MENGTSQITLCPAPRLESIATFFMPRLQRTQLIGDMAERYESDLQYSWVVTKELVSAISGNVRLAFRPILVLSEIGALCVGFAWRAFYLRTGRGALTSSFHVAAARRTYL
jgi:hypothetical protein